MLGDAAVVGRPVEEILKLLGELAELGQVRWVVGPNKFHHLYLRDSMALGAEGWAVPSLHSKRPELDFVGMAWAERALSGRSRYGVVD